MAKVQSDFYFRWAQDRIQATYTADQVLDSLIEYVGVDTTSNTVQITLPDTSGTDVVNGKKICIIDQGNAATNNITIIPNPSDSTTIELEASLVIRQDNAIVIFELVDDQWIIIGTSIKDELNLGGFYFNGNVTSTIIAAVNTYTDITGTGIAFTQNNNFSFATAPNALTSTFAEDYDGIAHISLTIEKTVGSAPRKVAVALFQDTGGGYVKVTGAELNGTAAGNPSTMALNTPVSVSLGDDFKLMIENRQAVENLIVEDMQLIIVEVE